MSHIRQERQKTREDSYIPKPQPDVPNSLLLMLSRLALKIKKKKGEKNAIPLHTLLHPPLYPIPLYIS